MPELPEVETIQASFGGTSGRPQDHRAGAAPCGPAIPTAGAARRPPGRAHAGELLTDGPSTSWASWTTARCCCSTWACRGASCSMAPAAGPHEHLTFMLRRWHPSCVSSTRDASACSTLASHAPASRIIPRLAGLGLEPLSDQFDGPALGQALAGRRTALKIALMDQRVVVGVGNIYASESLYRARLSPRRTAGYLRPAQSERLATAIRVVLEEAIGAGGSSLRDYVQTNGELGVFQNHFAVYGRTGEPCRSCGQPIRKLVQGQRTTFHCPRCQR